MNFSLRILQKYQCAIFISKIPQNVIQSSKLPHKQKTTIKRSVKSSIAHEKNIFYQLQSTIAPPKHDSEH